MKVETQRLIDRTVGTIICFIFSIFNHFFQKKSGPDETKRILIIILSEMGALVLGYPMFQRLKNKAKDPILEREFYREGLSVLHRIRIRTKKEQQQGRK